MQNSVTDVTDDFPRGEDILTSSQCSIKTTEHLTCRTDNIIMQKQRNPSFQRSDLIMKVIVVILKDIQ